jgi:hypothetical protein
MDTEQYLCRKPFKQDTEFMVDLKTDLKAHVRTPGWVGEFRSFIMRGNVVDLAVGVVIGAAFTGIVNSLVKDVFNPVIGLLAGLIFPTCLSPLKARMKQRWTPRKKLARLRLTSACS